MNVTLFAGLLALGAVACAPPTGSPPPLAANDVPAAPPLILNGEGHLDCTISAKENGTQKLVVQKGTGLEFDVTVSPIVDGTVSTAGPEKGGAYRFSSHLVGPGRGALGGVGPVAIDDLETKVNVVMNRYSQPGGAGTKLTFTSEDIGSRGVYVEFSGHAHADNGDRYAFRVTLGQPGPGSGGSVVPDGPAANAPIYAKMVVIQAPQTTVVSTGITTTVTKLR